jgi:hypothetical protein
VGFLRLGEEDPLRKRATQHNASGRWALLWGIVGFVLAVWLLAIFLGLFGSRVELLLPLQISLVSGASAAVLGRTGYRRAKAGTATNTVVAVTGMVLGLLTTVLSLALFGWAITG